MAIACPTGFDLDRARGAGIHWHQSSVVAGRTSCVFVAEDESPIHEHARRSGLPAYRVFEARTVVDPSTAAA
jgi:hypothetical protein